MYVQYDDVTVSLIPASAQAVLGYTDGTYDNRSAMTAAFPRALKTFLTVHGTDTTADGVDSEKGDASTAQVVWFVHQKLVQGVKPVVYTFLAQMQPMLDAIYASGVPREKILIMCAHVTERPHICGPECGFGLTETVDATQWTFTALGRSLDESLCTPAFFDRSLVPPKPPAPVDPHGYLRFSDLTRRSHVMEYDKLRPHPIKNRKRLAVLRADMEKGAHSVALGVINDAKISGKPRDWAKWHRGWKYQQLVHRANGKRVVK